MHTTTIDLQQIGADIWAAILGLELRPADALETHDADQRVVTGVVQITGDWSGAVTVQCPEALARTATALMFGSEPSEVTEDEVTDTVGELANMTGGNVKSLLAGTCQLSLPAVTTGRDYHVHISGAQVIERVTAECDGALVVMTMLERRN
ncbi:chemotaxis protein CheX [Egicoccus sp. AB-alg6-2]|uniref:chemotaxis protein CheX n=1 Tax=Egicoccus sp. AB-alg6-2 TaxID=3242692 RepID=UPI00359D00AE